jgi:hypothetical protein
LSVNNHDTSTSILSIKEIIGVIVVFSLVLYLLFPKGDIESLFEGESENTNLSINYLESVLLYHPNNAKLQMILIKNYHRAGEITKALELTTKLIGEVEDEKLLGELYKREYLLNKDIYFQTDDRTFLEKIRENLYDYFGYASGEDGEIDYMFFLGEATNMDFPDLQYIALVGLMEQRPELIDYAFEKEAFKLAMALGEKEEAYDYLLRLLKYDEVERELQVYAVGLLLENKSYNEVTALATSLFLSATNQDEVVTYFNIALHSIVEDTTRDNLEARELIELYKNSRELQSYDLHIIFTSLLQIGDIEGASVFAESLFGTHREGFDEEVTDLAVRSLIYAQNLPPALDITLYAYDEFKSSRWLDKSIQLATWLGKADSVIELNIKGYRAYDDEKYEQYLLKSTTLDSAYAIRGEIYKNRVKRGDYALLDELTAYYHYTGEISQGEEHFTKLLQKSKTKKIYHHAIEFAYHNSHYLKGIRLYEKYREKYGMEERLQEQSITKLLSLKQFGKAYQWTKELKEQEKPFNPRRLADLLWIEKDYPYLYDSLWVREEREGLKSAEYIKLIPLEKVYNQGKRVPNLYTKLWNKTSRETYLFALFYQYLEQDALVEFKHLRDGLSPKVQASLAKNINYHTVLAHYYEKKKEVKKAKESFEKALLLDSKSVTTHQSYLWFLVEHQLSNALQKEIRLLRKNPTLQSEVGFASVVGALMLQQNDLALRWLNPLLKSSDNIEYQVVYADILELQDRVEGARKVRLKLFRRLNGMIKRSPKLLKDKEFARVYLRMIVFYQTPYAKKAHYFNQLKALFDKEELAKIEIGWYAYRQSDGRAKELAFKKKIDIPWLNLYLAMSRDNKRAKQQLLKYHRATLSFRERVIASVDIGDRAGAYSLAFKGLEENSRDAVLYKIFDDMINSDYPRGEVGTHYQHLSPNLLAIETQLSYRWQLYKGIASKLSVSHHQYQKKRNKNLTDDTVSLSFKNRDKKFLWELGTALHRVEDDFIATWFDMEYRLSEMTLGLKSKYQNKTKETPKLQTFGLENSIALTLQKPLSKRIQLGLAYKMSKYKKQDMTKIGEAQHTQLSANYLLRAGYPDIQFSGYLTHNQYTNSANQELLPKDFWELSTQMSVGATAEHRIQRSWKPFGSVGLSVNDKSSIGTRFSLGVSGAMRGADSLSMSLDYGKGMNMISEPYYGLHLDYRF